MLRIWAAMPSSGRAMSVILPLAGLGEPLFEQGTFGGVAGEAERLFIGAARPGGGAGGRRSRGRGAGNRGKEPRGAARGARAGRRGAGARARTRGSAPGE